VAVNKPAALLSIPDREGKEPSLKSWLKEKYGAIFTVHRLDRDTSGIIVFARHEASHKYLPWPSKKRDDGEDLCRHLQGSLDSSRSIDAPLMSIPRKKACVRE